MATEPLPEDAAAGDESPATALRPQLRLHHLFALTAVAAVLLSLNGPPPDYWTDPNFRPPQFFVTAQAAWSVVYVLLISVAVTAIAYGIVWQRQGLVFFDQPGHWLLVEIGVSGLFAVVPTIAFRFLFPEMTIRGNEFPMTVMLAIGVYSLVMVFAVPMALNVYIGIKKCREWRWSNVFFLKAAARILFGLGSIIVPILLLVATIRDRRQRVTRDAAHWCGVWLEVAYNVMFLATSVLSVLSMYYVMSRR